MAELLHVYINKSHYMRMATCGDQAFAESPFLSMTVPNHCNLKTGFQIDVKATKPKRVHVVFEVLEVMSKEPICALKSKISLKVSRKIISHAN